MAKNNQTTCKTAIYIVITLRKGNFIISKELLPKKAPNYITNYNISNEFYK